MTRQEILEELEKLHEKYSYKEIAELIEVKPQAVYDFKRGLRPARNVCRKLEEFIKNN